MLLPIFALVFTDRARIMTTQPARNLFQRYAPLLLWMLFISLFSTSGFSADNTSRFVRPLLLWLFPEISEERIALTHFFVRKIAHFTEYAILGLFAARAFWGSTHRLLREHWFRAGAVLVVVYALLDELHQSFVSSRTGSLADSGIDIAGGLFALICLAYFNRNGQQIINRSMAG